MSDVPRPLRDILAECMRLERIGPRRPLWAEWQTFADDECEHVRRRADHVMRLLSDMGVELVQTGTPKSIERPDSPVIWRYMAAGGNERIVRATGERWEVATIAAGKETVEQAFSLSGAHLNAGMVLTDDPSARQIPGLGRQLAAVTEIYRLNAAGMGGST